MASQGKLLLSHDLLVSQITNCRACPLGSERLNAVPGDGAQDARLLFVGEAPGKNEDERGLPFVGRAGALLDTLLAEINLARGEVYITNTLKCRPPGNRDPAPSEVAACRPYLEQQLALIRPSAIVTLGRFAFNWFFPSRVLGEERGKILTYQQKYALLPLYHPAAALRSPKFREILEAEFRRIPDALAAGAKIATER